MTIVAKNSLTISNVNDGTITHYAYAYSADGTDRFTTVYPNLNLFTGTSDKPSTKTDTNWNIGIIGVYKTPKVGQEYTLSVEVPQADHNVWMEIYRWNAAGGRVDKLTSTVIKSGEKAHITFTWPDPGNSGVTQFAANLAWTNGTDTGTYSYCKAKLEIGKITTPWMPSSSEVTTADWPRYIGQYTDFTQADSTTPSAYTWSLIRGNDGKDGATGPAGPPGSTGAPGKIVSNTEPTTKFNGLTWKYSGANDITASDGTNILAGTEYYWNGTVWALYEINAHNINGDNLSVTNGTFKDGKIESIWGSNGVNGTTTIESNHLIIHSTDSVANTENTVGLDNEQGYAQVYVDKKTGRTITVQVSSQGFFVSDSTGPYVRVTPNGISTSSDKSQNSFQIGAGITINLERRGDMVEATLSGFINSPLTSNTKFSVGLIPVGYRPNRTANIMVHMTSSVNSSHIDVGIDGVCTWWGNSTSSGAPRGTQTWFTNDPTPQ